MIQACYNLRMQNKIHFGENLQFLQSLHDSTVDLIYIDPPFNTGKMQSRRQLKTTRSDAGDRIGFGDQSYTTEVIATRDYRDSFKDYRAFLEPRLMEAYRVLKPNGSLYLHIDFREAHYCKILLDEIFGRENFLNEIIWAYDFGGGQKTAGRPSMTTSFITQKMQKTTLSTGRTSTASLTWLLDWWGRKRQTRANCLRTPGGIRSLGQTAKKKTGYPTQKPLGVLERIIRASSNPGDLVLDFFAGSGTTGAACLKLGRRFILVDNNPQAIEVMQKRFANEDVEWTRDE